MNATPRIPSVCGPFNPNSDHSAVVSVPKMAFDTGTMIPEEMLTSQITYDVYHMNVATNAYFVFTLFSIHEKIPPFSSLKAEPYSAIMKAKGTKKMIAEIT